MCFPTERLINRNRLGKDKFRLDLDNLNILINYENHLCWQTQYGGWLIARNFWGECRWNLCNEISIVTLFFHLETMAQRKWGLIESTMSNERMRNNISARLCIRDSSKMPSLL